MDQENHQENIVHTRNGDIRGFTRGSLQVFRGIPYGDRTDGEYRFRLPRPVKAWEGIRDCTRFGPKAVQVPAIGDREVYPAQQALEEKWARHFTGDQPVDPSVNAQSENCLNLSIVTPGTDDRKRPVMVYIHGGGFDSGTGSVTMDISDRLAAEEDVVLVGVNHRLNIFGYLYLGDLDPDYEQSGLAGIYDLILALQWIQNNIEVFGGDPENVTLFGESGGGIKILTLMSMPEAVPFFQKAIVISGSEQIGIKTRENAHRQTLAILQKLGIAPADWKQILTLPADQIFAAAGAGGVIGGLDDGWYPVADGIHLPCNPERKYHACACSKDIPLMIGSSEDEALIFIPMLWGIQTMEKVRKFLQGNDPVRTTLLPNLVPEDVDALIRAAEKTGTKEREPWHILTQILSTANFLGGGAYMQARSRAAQGGASTWLWSTAYDSPCPIGDRYSCSWHTADLPLFCRAVWHKEAEALSRTMAHAIASFAGNGRPEIDGVAWEPFTKEHENTLLFDDRVTCQEAPYHDFYQMLMRAGSDQFRESSIG